MGAEGVTWVEQFNAARQFLDGLTMLVFSIGVFILFLIALVTVIRMAYMHAFPKKCPQAVVSPIRPVPDIMKGTPGRRGPFCKLPGRRFDSPSLAFPFIN